MKKGILQNLAVLALVIFVFSSSSKVIAQDERENEPKPAVVPGHIMKEVVGRILRHYFKPRAKEKIIYLSTQNIEPSWLPDIRNVKFQLLTNEEIEKRNVPVYFFHPVEVFEKGYEVLIGYGDPVCRSIGDNWYFRVLKNRTLLRNHNNHASGCSPPVFEHFKFRFP